MVRPPHLSFVRRVRAAEIACAESPATRTRDLRHLRL